MHYIYPKGITGEQLGIIMEYVDGVSPLFIDDSNEDLSFEKQKDYIKADDVVHVALGKCEKYDENLAKITKNLKDNNISYVLDVPEYVLKYINKLKEECGAKGITKFIGLMLDGFANNKHFGRLGNALSHRLKGTNAAVVYVCSDRISYAQYLQDKMSICSYFIFMVIVMIGLSLILCVLLAIMLKRIQKYALSTS